MLLQKTGWRIKKFMSHRRSSSLEDPAEIMETRCTDNKASARISRRLSWLSQSSPDVSALRRASSSASIRLSAPEPSTAHSSASSLCSCDCEANATSNFSLSRYQVSPAPEILYLPLTSATTKSGDAKTWGLIFSGASSHSSHSDSSKVDTKDSLGIFPTEATFDLMEALTIDPIDYDNDKTPTQSIQDEENTDADNKSLNVERLIRETDQAFQVVGRALADAKAATTVTQTVLSPRGVLKKQPRSLISKTMSMSKERRRIVDNKKSHLLSRALGLDSPPTTDGPSRWTLMMDVTTNMAEIFSGKMFRMEVDELLTPSRMQQLKQVETESEPRISLESTCSDEADEDTPRDPFHLESLLSRISTANPPSSPSPVLPPPAIPRAKEPLKERETRSARRANVVVKDTSMTFKDLNFPAPPRQCRPSRAPPLLPTIPEVPPLTLTPPHSSDEKLSRIMRGKSEEAHDYVSLSGTPFTLTSPLFRHGPIRMKRKPISPQEEPLDWTAFQMAISRTIDEQDEERDEVVEWNLEEAEFDDITSWFSDLGIGMGRMVKETPKKKRIKVYVKDGNMQKRSWRGTLGQAPMIKGDLQEARVWGVKMEEDDSLPPNPMLNLMSPIPSKEIVPMGHNLGHDLGDFLNWETQHVQNASSEG